MIRVRFLGSGDAFGSGGRLNTCFHVGVGDRVLLIDCGGTALPAMKVAGIDRNAVDTILVTQFLGDHFGSVPCNVLNAQFFATLRAPLTIAGPEGLREWLSGLSKLHFQVRPRHGGNSSHPGSGSRHESDHSVPLVRTKQRHPESRCPTGMRRMHKPMNAQTYCL